MRTIQTLVALTLISACASVPMTESQCVKAHSVGTNELSLCLKEWDEYEYERIKARDEEEEKIRSRLTACTQMLFISQDEISTADWRRFWHRKNKAAGWPFIPKRMRWMDVGCISRGDWQRIMQHKGKTQ